MVKENEKMIMKKKKLKFLSLIVVVNLFSLILSTLAWFELRRVEGELFDLEVYTGDILQVSMDPETGWQATFDFTEAVTGGFFETGQNLTPVTTTNGYVYYNKYGDLYTHPANVDDRFFLEFDFYLRSPDDRNVYLGEGSGFTSIGEGELDKASRVSFTKYSDDENRVVESSIIWEPDNAGVGSYGEGIYDENYATPADENYFCYTPANPSGYLLCPDSIDKAEYASNAHGDEIAIPTEEPPGEDLTGIPSVIELEGGNLDGRLLTIRIWLEGFDPDCQEIFELTNEQVEVRIDFEMTLYFSSREIV